ncbi:MAG TPA: alpha/beta hydrolase [Chloroflexota bacterium]|nr:alpha/beta hydrolase [Chloroflexota bacterium]
MAVETLSAHQTGPRPVSLGRIVLWATAATLGVSGAVAAAVGGISGLLVYQYARARGIWGTDEPPEGSVEEVTFASTEDDLPLSGWFFRSPETLPAPTVLLCHGVWTGRRECLPMALRFHQAGYNVLCFDFRAHGLSGGRFTSVGHHETKDVLGAVDYLRQRSEVDPLRIGVVGFSMGAAATIQAAARCPDIAAVVADSAYTAFVDAVRYSFRRVAILPHYPFAPLSLQWARWMIRSDPRRLRPVDVIRAISPRPILITHGGADDIVPPQHATLLFQAAEEPKELWIAPGVGHVGARDTDPDGYFARIEAFLRKALAEPNVILSAASRM